MRRIRSRLTFANAMSLVAVFIALGGAAYAANTVRSSDIVNDEVYSADVRNDTLAGGGLAAADLRSGSVATAEVSTGGVQSVDIQDESLTGGDIADGAVKAPYLATSAVTSTTWKSSWPNDAGMVVDSQQPPASILRSSRMQRHQEPWISERPAPRLHPPRAAHSRTGRL